MSAARLRRTLTGAAACGPRAFSDGLALAAAPTFALMALASATGAAPMALCTAAPGPLPIDGMTAMYLLMSLFHLPPWLKRAFGRGRMAA